MLKVTSNVSTERSNSFHNFMLPLSFFPVTLSLCVEGSGDVIFLKMISFFSIYL